MDVTQILWIHSVPFSPPQRLCALKRKDLNTEAAWRSSGRHSQMILRAHSLPTLKTLYLPYLLTSRKEAHLWSTRTEGVSTPLQDNTWLTAMSLVQKIMAQSDTDGPDWGHIYASIQGPTDRQRIVWGVEWDKDLKAFQQKSNWMLKWSSFDVAEFKYAHIVSMMGRQAQREMSSETHTLLTTGEKNTVVHFFNEC